MAAVMMAAGARRKAGRTSIMAGRGTVVGNGHEENDGYSLVPNGEIELHRSSNPRRKSMMLGGSSAVVVRANSKQRTSLRNVSQMSLNEQDEGAAEEAKNDETAPLVEMESPKMEWDSDVDEDDEQFGLTGHISDHNYFQGFVMFLIVGNSALIAAEAQYVQDEDMKPMFRKYELFFTISYCMELALRLFEKGCPFFYGTGAGWNIFDFTLTISGAIDALASMFSGKKALAGASAGRLFRLLRIVRMFRALKFLHDIQIAILIAGSATGKLLALVLLIVFVAGVVVTQLCKDIHEPVVQAKFGYLGISMWTLFRMMTLAVLRTRCWLWWTRNRPWSCSSSSSFSWARLQ
jgi:hypothetical protein